MSKYKIFFLAISLFIGALLLAGPNVLADDESEVILKVLIKKGIISSQEVEEMRAEIKKEKTTTTAAIKEEAPADLEKRVSVLEEKTNKVDMEKLVSKLKLKGRWAAGYYDSGKAGSFPSGSFEVPEAKLQLSFEPDDINKIVMRMNLNNATFNNLDFFYVDADLKKFLNLPVAVSSRLGRMKLDFGEETWTDNPVDSVLASNSIGKVSGNDEGLQFSGKLGKARPVNYAISITNGTSGTGSDTSTDKSFTGKLSYNIFDPLYLSGSYYNSGSMKSSNSELSLGGLVTPPSGALRWSREVWEIDLRYDYKKGKIFNSPAYSDSKAIFRMAYGQFDDDASGVVKRSGSYGFLEETYNLTKKFYVAGRESVIAFNNDTTASLNSVTGNEFQRYSLGAGYRFTDNTIFKLGYDWNLELGANTQSADNNLLSAVVASQF